MWLFCVADMILEMIAGEAEAGEAEAGEWNEMD